MATYATAADVEVELGRPASSPAETSKWEAWLDRVERAIERAFKRAGLDLATQVVMGDPTAEDVRDVMVAAVLRKIHNPEGFTSTTRSLDDASITTRRDHGNDGEPLALTVGDLESLLPSFTSGAFSTRPGFDADRGCGPDVWSGEVGNWVGPWIG